MTHTTRWTVVPVGRSLLVYADAHYVGIVTRRPLTRFNRWQATTGWESQPIRCETRAQAVAALAAEWEQRMGRPVALTAAGCPPGIR